MIMAETTSSSSSSGGSDNFCLKLSVDFLTYLLTHITLAPTILGFRQWS